jgi:hypothetical protein
MTPHRILHHAVNHEGIPAPRSLWEGNESPDVEQINAIQQAVQELNGVSGRDPFNQRMDDLITIQKQRTPSILGWKTIQVINAFDTLESE